MNFSKKNHEHKKVILKNVSRKIILGIVFVFAISFSFAGTNLTDLKFEKTAKMKCVTVITSCGIYGNACGETQVDRAMLALAIDDWVCG